MAGQAKDPISGKGLPGFAPSRIVTASNSLDLDGVLAVRVSAAVDYQIDGAGTTGTMPPGITLKSPGVSSFLFAESTVVEVMDAR